MSQTEMLPVQCLLYQYPYPGKIEPRENHFQYLAIFPPELLKSIQTHIYIYVYIYTFSIYLQNQSLATYVFDYLYFQNIKTVQ